MGSCVLCTMCYILHIEMPKIWGLVYGIALLAADFPCSPLQPVPSAKETAATSEKNSAMKASSVNQSTKEESLA